MKKEQKLDVKTVIRKCKAKSIIVLSIIIISLMYSIMFFLAIFSANDMNFIVELIVAGTVSLAIAILLIVFFKRNVYKSALAKIRMEEKEGNLEKQKIEMNPFDLQVNDIIEEKYLEIFVNKLKRNNGFSEAYKNDEQGMLILLSKKEGRFLILEPYVNDGTDFSCIVTHKSQLNSDSFYKLEVTVSKTKEREVFTGETRTRQAFDGSLITKPLTKTESYIDEQPGLSLRCKIDGDDFEVSRTSDNAEIINIDKLINYIKGE